MIDFDSLASLANNPKALMNLWASFFKLDNWIFVVDASLVSDTPAPFVGFMDKKPWLFTFTDTQRAYDFAKKNKLLDSRGECLFISVNTNAARKMLLSTKSKVEGIRVNEGPYGWFSPLANIEKIHSLLQKEGIL